MARATNRIWTGTAVAALCVFAFAASPVRGQSSGSGQPPAAGQAPAKSPSQSAAQSAAELQANAATAARDAAVASTISSWIHLDAPPGGEPRAIAALRSTLPTWTVDGFGNLVRRVGSGRPRRVVACAMDVPGFVVSAITADGFVRLHHTGTPPHALWDQFHEAQQLRILTARGDVPAVVAVANGHFARQHRGDTAVVSVDQLWVDLGVHSRAQAESLGVALLDAVVADRPMWTYAGYAAGPGAGARAGCAAVASAATAAITATPTNAAAATSANASRSVKPPALANAPATSGETVFVLSVQRSFGWTGLAAVIARVGEVDQVTLFDDGRVSFMNTMVPTSRLGALRKTGLARVLVGDSVRIINPRVRFVGSLVESIHADEARLLLTEARRAAGVVGATADWIAPPIDTVRTRVPRRDGYEKIEQLFMSLADLPAVPGHEFRVREAILARLPTWAKAVAVTDNAGNVVVGAGPERDTVAFLAHMDEVSFEIEAINGDGSVRLARRGGVVATAWEGQPAMLHFDRDSNGLVAESLRGAFVPRDSARVKTVGAMTAWFGMDSATLVAHGVTVGLGVTAYKRATRLAGTRVTGRGSDDRTGSTALLMALQQITPKLLTHRVLFVWTTREESGLDGAAAFGAQHGRSLKRVYSVDTFVSSDTPLEQAMFAYAPLGNGAVLRGLDDGSIVPPAERERILQIAKTAGIAVQVGTTHGATDGSSIAPFGAPNVGLSWPGRYSHSPGEVLDLRDVSSLIRLIAAVAIAK